MFFYLKQCIIMRLFNLLLLVSVFFIASCEDDTNDTIDFGEPPAESILSSGTVTVVTKSTTRYHVVVFGGPNAPTSTIVETETGAVLVDTGISNDTTTNVAEQLRSYADSLKKPLNIIITHSHRDHFAHINAFQDVPVYAETDVVTSLMANPVFPNLYTGTVNAVASTQTLAGLEFNFAVVDDAETGHNGYIHVPSLNILFPGDLVYNQAHNYLAEYTPKDDIDELSNWIAALNTLKTSFGEYDYIFVGHNGYREDVSTVIDENIAYLTDAQGLIKGTKELSAGGFASSNEEVVDELAALYPNYLTAALFFALASPNFPEADWF